MQEPTVQPGQTGTPPPAAGAETEDQAMATEAFVNDLIKMRTPEGGNVPGVTDEIDGTQRMILENQFRQDTRALMSDVREMIEEVSPNVTRSDLQKFTRAFVGGDPLEMWKVAQTAARKEAESQEDDEKLEDLRVEGGNSGTQGTERTPINTTSQAALRLAEAFRR